MGSELISRSRETFLQLFWPSQSVVGGVTKSSAHFDLLPNRRRQRRRRKYKQKPRQNFLRCLFKNLSRFVLHEIGALAQNLHRLLH